MSTDMPAGASCSSCDEAFGDARLHAAFDARAERAASAPRQTAADSGAVLQFAIGTPLAAIEREVIVATLAHCRGRKRETAELLGISLKTLYNRLNEYRGEIDAGHAA